MVRADGRQGLALVMQGSREPLSLKTSGTRQVGTGSQGQGQGRSSAHGGWGDVGMALAVEQEGSAALVCSGAMVPGGPGFGRETGATPGGGGQGVAREGLCRAAQKARLDWHLERRWQGPQGLDEACDLAVARLVQEQGAEDVVEEGRVVLAGTLAVRVEVHFQDLWLHRLCPIWAGVPLQHEVHSIHGTGRGVVAETQGWWLGTRYLEQLCEGPEDLSLHAAPGKFRVLPLKLGDELVIMHLL